MITVLGRGWRTDYAVVDEERKTLCLSLGGPCEYLTAVPRGDGFPSLDFKWRTSDDLVPLFTFSTERRATIEEARKSWAEIESAITAFCADHTRICIFDVREYEDDGSAVDGPVFKDEAHTPFAQIWQDFAVVRGEGRHPVKVAA